MDKPTKAITGGQRHTEAAKPNSYQPSAFSPRLFSAFIHCYKPLTAPTHLYPFLFTLFSCLTFCSSHAQGNFYAQPNQTLEVRAILELPPNFALHKRSQFWLVTPFGQTLELAATGADWALEPAYYLERLEPLVWRVRVPVGAKAGRYRLEVRATVLACDKSVGVCQKHLVRAAGQLLVGQNGRSIPVRLRFDPSRPFGS